MRVLQVLLSANGQNGVVDQTSMSGVVLVSPGVPFTCKYFTMYLLLVEILTDYGVYLYLVRLVLSKLGSEVSWLMGNLFRHRETINRKWWFIPKLYAS